MDFLNYAQLIIGPAGSGKSTYCKIIQSHCLSIKRTVRIINLDPAAENFEYDVDVDIKELISVEDVMKKKKLGPNGALIYCMDYILSKFSWLEEQINDYGDNNYFLIDCPGQLELYAHYPIMKELTKKLKNLGVNVMSVFCLDCTFTSEYSKYISGTSFALACMVQLELPHLNVLTKADLIKSDEVLDKIREIDIKHLLIQEEESNLGKKTKFFNLNKALVELLDNYSLVNVTPLNFNDEDSINEVLYNCDMTLQYLENQEPKDELYEEKDVNDDEYSNEFNNENII